MTPFEIAENFLSGEFLNYETKEAHEADVQALAAMIEKHDKELRRQEHFEMRDKALAVLKETGRLWLMYREDVRRYQIYAQVRRLSPGGNTW